MSAQLTVPFSQPEQQALAERFAVWIFLATEVLFFGPLFVGYVYVRMHFPDAVAAASRHTDLALGTANTALLLTSSLCVALVSVRERGGRALLWAAAALGIAFLVIKGVEYRQEFAEQLFPDRHFAPSDAGSLAHRHGMQLFFLLYFAMTALHALHLLVGIVLCVAVGWALGHRRADRDSVELAGLYWHFVDVVWIVLYPLLYLVGRSGS